MIFNFHIQEVFLIQEKIPFPGNFPYPGFLYKILHVFIPGLPYPENFPHPENLPYPVNYTYRVIFSCPVKASIWKSDQQKKIKTSPSLQSIHLLTSLIAVDPEPNDLLLGASLMQFMNNYQPFIHKTNTWVYTYTDYSM